MHDKKTSRRSLLKSAGAVAGLGIVGSLSGCSSAPFVGGDGGTDSEANARIERVPEGVTFVTHVNVGGMLSDDVFVQRMNELLQEQSTAQSSPQSVDEAFSQVESEAGLDPRDVSEVLVYGNAQANTGGAILWAEWEQDTVTSALTENGFEEDSVGATTVYARSSSEADDMSVALLDDGAYGLGTGESLNTLVDTWNGDSASVSGEVETAFTSAQGGYVQLGLDVPTEQLPDDGTTVFGRDSQILRNIEYGYGSVTDADNGREMVVTMEASDEDGAESIEGLIDFARATAERELQETSQRPGQMQDLFEALTNTEADSNGTTVTVRNENGVTVAIAALAVAGTFVLGFGSSAGRSRSVSERQSPQVMFEVDYDGSSLVVTHTAGDNVRADRLYVQGAGGQGQSWANLGGSTAGSVDGQPAVAAGDRLELTDVSSDYRLELVWRSSNTSTTLMRDRGPDA